MRYVPQYVSQIPCMNERYGMYHRNTNSIRVVYTFAVHNLSFTICFDYGRDHGLDDEFL
jgi:hypothetical protein